MITKVAIFTVLTLSASRATQDLAIRQLNHFGYSGEAHAVTTDDGYILTVHRITPAPHTNASKVCLLIHGICSTSAEFLLTKRTSLALFLHDSGYDVFLGNTRGGSFSQRHAKLHSNDSRFWDFSLHEMANHDLPAIIDFVLDATGEEQLAFVGHSQGATLPLILLATQPNYNNKIRQLHLSAPAPFMANFPNPFLRKFGTKMVKIYSHENVFNLTPIADFLQRNLNKNCRLGQPFYFVICVLFEFLLLGDNFTKLEADYEIYPTFLTLFSPVVSKQQGLHFFQFIDSGKFRRFDYGRRENLKRYGSVEPPAYDLKLVTAPTFIYCAERDGVVSKRDLEHLREVLPNVVRFKLLKNYNHLDFDVGLNAREEVHTDLLRWMNRETKSWNQITQRSSNLSRSIGN